MTLGKNLQILRKEKGLTQDQVAQIIGVTRQTISGYESGRTQPDIETLDRIAKIYEVDIENILYGKAVKNTAGSIKRIACIFAIILLLLSLLSATMTFAEGQLIAHYYGITKEDLKNGFNINDYEISQENLNELMEKQGKLLEYRNRVDGLLTLLPVLGSVYLFATLINSKARINYKTKILSAALFCLVFSLIPTIIGLFDPIGRAAINFNLSQIKGSIMVMIAVFAQIGTEAIRNRK